MRNRFWRLSAAPCFAASRHIVRRSRRSRGGIIACHGAPHAAGRNRCMPTAVESTIPATVKSGAVPSIRTEKDVTHNHVLKVCRHPIVSVGVVGAAMVMVPSLVDILVRFSANCHRLRTLIVCHRKRYQFDSALRNLVPIRILLRICGVVAGVRYTERVHCRFALNRFGNH